MKKRTKKNSRKQGLSTEQLKDFQEPKTIDELLAVFAEYGEKVDAESIEDIFQKSGQERMSVMDVTAWLLDQITTRK